VSVPGQSKGFEYVSFDELLKSSDYLICTCTLNKETELIFDERAFKRMKSNSVLINVSRGMIVNQEDLYNALNERRIAAAGLDVTSPLFLEKNHKLLSLKNCFITPYMGRDLENFKMFKMRINFLKFKFKAWSDINTTNTRLSLVIDNLIRFMEGKALLHEITK
jgi:phosphoglycerate dehydrogenase-like enzyme